MAQLTIFSSPEKREGTTHTIHFVFLKYLHNKNDKYWFKIDKRSIGKDKLLKQLESLLVL